MPDGLFIACWRCDTDCGYVRDAAVEGVISDVVEGSRPFAEELLVRPPSLVATALKAVVTAVFLSAYKFMAWYYCFC